MSSDDLSLSNLSIDMNDSMEQEKDIQEELQKKILDAQKGVEGQGVQLDDSKDSLEKEQIAQKQKEQIPLLTWYLSYSTPKELLMLERNLGFWYYSLMFFVIFYFLIYTMLEKQYYLKIEKSYGSSILQLVGTTHSQDEDGNIQIFDDSDFKFVQNQKNELFIPTRIKITPYQQVGECPNPQLQCTEDKDCIPNELPNIQQLNKCGELIVIQDLLNTTIQNKRKQIEYRQNIQDYIAIQKEEDPNYQPQALYQKDLFKACEARQYCPHENVLNAMVTQIHDLRGVGHMRILLNGKIEFPQLQSKVYRTIEGTNFREFGRERPDEVPNVFFVEAILKFAGLQYDDVRYTGAIIKMTLLWECNLDSNVPCIPKIKIIRLDQKGMGGFSIKRSETYLMGQEEYRDQFTYNGIKLIIENVGIAYRFSFQDFIMQFFVFLALVSLVKSITEFIMLQIFQENLHFKNMKYIKIES